MVTNRPSPLTATLVAIVLSAASSAVQCRSAARDLPHDPATPGASTTDTKVEEGGSSAALGPAVDRADAAATTASADSRPVPLGWNDPAALAGLAKSCDFTPWADAESKAETWYSCQGDLPEQSCVFDPCYDKGQTCKSGCARTCESCDAACAGSCGRCEAACHDDACRMACAKTTAACRMECAAGRDRCVTAGCTQQYLSCAKVFNATWSKGNCAPHCGELIGCWADCDGAQRCQNRCYQRQVPGCPSLSDVCMWGDATHPTGPYAP